MLTDQFDLLIVGGGFRATALLASAPELFTLKTGIIDRRGKLGGGDFHRYQTFSTSAGDRFLKSADSSVRDMISHVESGVLDSTAPVMLPELASALDEVGMALTTAFDPTIIDATALEVQTHSEHVEVLLDNNSRMSASHVVLATGRHELPAIALSAWADRTVLSSDFLGQFEPAVVTSSLTRPGPIVIAGSAHSAMSALRTILKRREELDQRYLGRQVYVTQRSSARLYYESIEIARREQIAGREHKFDSNSICPETGVVHRDTGLRGESKSLFEDLWNGDIDGVSLVRLESLSGAHEYFDEASLIIQSLGYVGRSPVMRQMNGVVYREPTSVDRFPATNDGRAHLANGEVSEMLSILRLDPTPPDLRDTAAYGQKLNQILAERIMRNIQRKNLHNA